MSQYVRWKWIGVSLVCAVLFWAVMPDGPFWRQYLAFVMATLTAAAGVRSIIK